MTPPETSDQGNMVSQRQGEWVPMPPTSVNRIHAPELEQYAENQRPKTRDHREARLYRYAGTDLYQWYSKVGTSVFADPFGEPFVIEQAAPPPEPRADEGGDIGYPTPLGALQFRMEQGGHTQADLARLIGSRSRAAEILAGKRGLSKAHIRVLADEWGIPARSLLGPATCALAAEASPLGAEPDATGIDGGRDEQITQPSHDDEGLIEALSRELGDCDDEICGNSRRNDCAYCATASRLVERVIGPVISRLKGELEEARYVKARYDRETIPELAGTAQEHFAGRLKAEAEVKELRSGLKPFAEADVFASDVPNNAEVQIAEMDDGSQAPTVAVGHFRKARSLLSPAQEGLSSARASRDARSSTRPEGQSVDGGEG